MEDAGGIFTVIHISTDHLLSDHCVLDPPPPNSHVHSHHIHTIAVHTDHIHTSSVQSSHICTSHISTLAIETNTEHGRCKRDLHCYLYFIWSLFIWPHRTWPPALMSTTTTSTQLPSTSITSTHPLFTAVTSAPHISPTTTLFLPPSPKILATETTVSTTEVFVVSLFDLSRNVASRTRHWRCGVDDRGGT